MISEAANLNRNVSNSLSIKKAIARIKMNRAYLLVVYSRVSPFYSIPATIRNPMFLPTNGGGTPINTDKIIAIIRAGNLVCENIKVLEYIGPVYA